MVGQHASRNEKIVKTVKVQKRRADQSTHIPPLDMKMVEYEVKDGRD